MHTKATLSLLVFLYSIITVYAQTDEKSKLAQQNQANNLVFEGNTLLENNNFEDAEVTYRKALSEAPNQAVGAYNLSNSYYKKGNFDEALFRAKDAAKHATTKQQKHHAFHNIGNILMQNKKCKEASEAFKNALRNNPTDEETRYNFALAKDCAEQQKQDGGGDDNKDDKDKDQQKDKKDQDKKNQDDNKDNKDKKDDKDKKDKDKDKGKDDEDYKGKPKDDKNDNKKDNNKGDDKKDDNKKQKPRPGQMSPQQMKNILEAMQNQEQKVQEKMNAQKQKGAKVKSEKDW